ncbi:two-component system sensor histidine kinase/response [Flavobacteriales bacterium ALC-1]|nr:two-component system sensor histidine kinase/response [Flavobacteriales bacterium ALC-1]
MKINQFIVILLLQFIGCYISYSQIEISNFDNLTHYNIKNGLSADFVGDIIEDKYGFLWISNGKSVTRFDGNHFTNYDSYTENDSIQKLGNIHSLTFDKTGERLFIGSSFGVFYTSIKDIQFKPIQTLVPSINIPIKRIAHILFENENVCWASSLGSGLIRIDLKNNTLESFRLNNPTQENNAWINSINTIEKDPTNNNILWLGSGAGLIRFNTITKTYNVHVYNNNVELPHNRIRKILASENNIYLGTWREGLVVFNKQTQSFVQPIKKNVPNSHLLILELFKGENQNLWITSADGLIQFNTETNTLEKVRNNKPSKSTIYGVRFVDSNNIIWFGYGKGLFKYNPSNSQNTFIELEERTNLENPFLIKKILRHNDFIYIQGHNGSGIYKINPIDFSYEIIKIGSKITENRNLRDIIQMDDDHLLIVASEKLYILNTKTQMINLAPLQIDHPSPSNQSIVKDKDNRFWVGGRRNGLTALNFKNNTIKNYKEEFSTYKEGNHIWINKLYIDNKNKLWIAKGAESVMDLDNLKISLLNPKDSIPSYHDASMFLDDNKGRVWVAGYDNGLGYTSFKDFQQGISHQIDGYFSGVYKYNDSIMLTTGRGILGKYNMTTNTYTAIDINNNKEYITGPITKKNSKEYVVGCRNGILIYRPENQIANVKTPIPYISKISGNGKTYYENNSLENQELIFESGTTNLAINISALDFQQPEQTVFSYKLQEEWIDLGTNQEINITNLNQGNFAFKIKSCNNFGDCNETRYNFTILSPWYRSWLAYLIYSILFLTIVWLLYRFNLDKKLALAEKQKAIEFDELKTKMYANISHEFRTPLTLINGLSKVLIDENNSNKNTEKLKGIHRSGDQLLKLVNQILGLVSFDAGKVKANYKNGDVIAFIKQCVSYYKFHSDSKQQELTLSSKIESLKMDFDDDKLQKIINNVLSNAIKFTPIKGKIDIEIKKQDKQLILKISDSGKGIEAKHLPYIFDRYYKTLESSLDVGNGIGMALTKELITLLKGSITVESEIEKGTSFIIQLPIKNTVKTNSQLVYKIPFLDKSYTTENIESASLNNKVSHTLLLVEDNEEIRNYITLLLGEYYNIITAKNGVEGLKIAKNKNIDFIISDVMMPKMDGFEFCEHIKSDLKTSHIPFIIISAKTAKEDKLRGYQLGIDAYLFKPFDKDELQLIIKNLIQKKQKQVDYFSKLLKLKENPKNTVANQLDLNLIANLQEHILNKSNKLSIEQLAKKLGTSRTQLHRKIKALTNMSVTNYINHIRVEKAKFLLKNTKLNSNEIAYEIGFESSTYFSRVFKKELGITPAIYREKHT